MRSDYGLSGPASIIRHRHGLDHQPQLTAVRHGLAGVEPEVRETSSEDGPGSAVDGHMRPSENAKVQVRAL